MKLLLLLFQVILTFDPYSVKTIEYRPEDVKYLDSGAMAYHRVLLTFEKMIVLKPGESPMDKAAPPAPKMHPDSEPGTFHYKPKDCKPLGDIRQRWVCTDKDWGKKPPTIWWEPRKKLADPMPRRQFPNS